MKKIIKLIGTGLLTVALFAGSVFANTPSTPVSDGGVIPYIVDDPSPGGNVSCSQLGYQFGSDRVNYNGGFDGSFPSGITVTVTNGTYVEWGSTFPIGAVIVKGGNSANVYEYNPQSLSGDSGLASPTNASGSFAELSNLTFCWNPENGNGNGGNGDNGNGDDKCPYPKKSFKKHYTKSIKDCTEKDRKHEKENNLNIPITPASPKTPELPKSPEPPKKPQSPVFSDFFKKLW